MHLNAKTVATLVLPGSSNDVIHFDDELPGFGFRLRRRSADAPARATWILQYRLAHRTRRVKIGDAGVVSAEAARAAAKRELARVTLGRDPQGEKRDRRERDLYTLRSIVEKEFLPAKKPLLRAATFTETQRYLTGPLYFKPLHGMPIDVIERRDISLCLATITRNSGSTTAARARTALSSFFAWSIQMGLAESNPVIGALRPEESKGRDRVLSNDELALVWNACGDDEFGRIIRLLILTGCRRQEIGGMRFSELDRELGVWVLPAARAKNKQALTLPLAAPAWGIINSVPPVSGRDQLFGVRSEGGFSNFDNGKIEFDRKLGTAIAKWNIHDLRRSVATHMAEDLAIQPHIIEAMLNHVSGHKAGIAGIYNRAVYHNEKRAALMLWADHVRAIASGGERKVLPFTSGQVT
jgi:integrase